MIDLQYLRENPDLVQEKAASKNISINVQDVLELDKRYRELSSEVQELQSRRNRAAKERDIEGGKRIKGELGTKEDELAMTKKQLDTELLKIPALPKDDVKVGKNEDENDVIKTEGEKPEFGFKVRDHLEIGELLDVIDVKRAAKVSGARFAYLKNEGALLELALVQYSMETLAREGFIPVIPPTIINYDVMKKLGYAENGGDEDMFHLRDEEKVLVGTAEHSLVPMHADELFSGKELPKRYVGFSSAFRREAGSYGKDTRGILRVHQFDKIEMVSFVKEGEDDQEHEYLLNIEEKFFQELKIPYQVVKMCTGDLGFPASRKYDIEAWIPSQGKYREVTSVSTVGDFQSRRLNIKYLDEGEKKFASILNGTAFAIGRTLIAILENYQQEDGSVIIPDALQKYIGKEKIEPKTR